MLYDLDIKAKREDIKNIIKKICEKANSGFAMTLLCNYSKNEFEILNLISDGKYCKKNLIKLTKEDIKSFCGNKNKIVVNSSSECYFEDIKREIWIPIYLSNEKSERVIGLLYFGSSNKKNNNYYIEKDLINEKTKKLIEKISNCVNIIYMQRKFQSIFNSIIGIITKIAEEKESYNESHPYNVSYLSVMIAKEIGLDLKQIKVIKLASMLHDIGKVYINDSILNKRGKLTHEEYEEIKKHCYYGYKIVKEFDKFIDNRFNLADIVKYHHENYDGTGYPEGLKGEKIPLESRIIRIADSIDAMVSKRVYKEAKSIKEAIKDIKIYGGTLYDPSLLEVAVKVVEKYLYNIPERTHSI